MHYIGSNSFLFINATKIYKFKAKDSEIKKDPLCLANISGNFSANNMKKKKTGLNGCVCNFPFDDRAFDISNAINMHKYLVQKHDIK